MAMPSRGEVWLVDLGFAAKTRPCLVLSIPFTEFDRALIALVPHTTAIRNTQHEVSSSTKFLDPGAFDAQNLVTVSAAKLVRRLGHLPPEQLEQVEEAVRRWLGL